VTLGCVCWRYFWCACNTKQWLASDTRGIWRTVFLSLGLVVLALTIMCAVDLCLFVWRLCWQSAARICYWMLGGLVIVHVLDGPCSGGRLLSVTVHEELVGRRPAGLPAIRLALGAADREL